jgi:hypothetical protein
MSAVYILEIAENTIEQQPDPKGLSTFSQCTKSMLLIWF